MSKQLTTAAILIAFISYNEILADRWCDDTNCILDNCVCLSEKSPLQINATTQFVLLTFDDAVTDYNYNQYYYPLLNGKRNPDGSRISSTFFIPHEYTDYEVVNNLWKSGHEIALNSITSNSNKSYWEYADEDLLYREFYGEKQLIAKFANISIDSIIGVRTPELALHGDASFSAYNRSGLIYDNSWPTPTSKILYPYTLDHLSSQNCAIGTCPVTSFPGFWVVPIADLFREDGWGECHVVLGCFTDFSLTAEEIFSWLKKQFDRHYLSEKAPLPLILNAAWFAVNPNAFAALSNFLDYLATNEDVFVVSVDKVVEWRKNPIEVEQYKVPVETREASCSPRNCFYFYPDQEFAMRSCIDCPSYYPWLDNPLGEISDEY